MAALGREFIVNKMLRFLIIIAPLLDAALAKADAPIDLTELTHEEQQQFFACRQRGMMDPPCEALAQKTCSFPINAEAWFCMDFNFNKCKPEGFLGNQCQEVVKRVCNVTQDQFDVYCDRYRYEVCLSQEFKGEGCDATRLRYVLPRVRDSIDGLLQGFGVRDKYIERIIQNDSEIEINHLHNYYCSLANGERSSSLASYCSASEDIYDMAEFGRLYRASEIKINSRNLKVALYEGLLRGSASANLWDRIEANWVWIAELDSSDGIDDPISQKLLTYAARVLSELGDDSVTSTFLLLEASLNRLPEVRVAAMEGLGNRRYPSGLAMLALMNGMLSQEPAEKAAAIAGIGKRWQADVNSTYSGRLDHKKLGTLFDCKKVTVNAGIYSKVNTLEDVAKIDFMAPENICAIGMGAQLLRTKTSVWTWIDQHAKDPSEDAAVRSQALRALGRLAFASTVDRETARKVALSVLTEPARDREIVMGALDLLSSVSVLNPTQEQNTLLFNEILRVMREEISLVSARAPNAQEAVSRLGITLALLVKHNFLPPEGASHHQNSLNALSPILEECVQNMLLPFAVRTQCFSAANSAESFRLESAIFPQILTAVKQGNTSERRTALTLIEQGVFLFLDQDLTFNNIEHMTELGHAISSYITGMIGSTPTGEIEFLATSLGALRRISIDSDHYKNSAEIKRVWQNFVAELKSPGVHTRLTRFMDHLFPRLTSSPVPLKSWLDAFSITKKDILYLDVHKMGGFLVSEYFLRRDLLQSLQDHLRSLFTMEDALVFDFAWEPWKSLFLLSAEGETAKVPEHTLMKWFWEIDHPDKTEDPDQG